MQTNLFLDSVVYYSMVGVISLLKTRKKDEYKIRYSLHERWFEILEKWDLMYYIILKHFLKMQSHGKMFMTKGQGKKKNIKFFFQYRLNVIYMFAHVYMYKHIHTYLLWKKVERNSKNCIKITVLSGK